MENKFEIKSGKAVLSDPCYELGTWCQGVVDKVKNGEWIGDVDYLDAGDWGRRVTALLSHHKDYHTTADEVFATGEKLPFDGGVDSGQFGHFDYDGYRNDETIAGVKRISEDADIIREEEPWYSICCDRTLGDKRFGVIPLGVVSSSGYGDGSYDTYGVKNADGEYVAFATMFINEVAEEDEPEDMFPDELDPAGGHGLSSHE